MGKYRLKDFKPEDTVEVTNSIVYEGEQRQVSVTWKIKGSEDDNVGVLVERLDGTLAGRVAVLEGETKVSPIGRTAQRIQREAERAERMTKMQQIVSGETGKSVKTRGSQISKAKTPSKSGGSIGPSKLYVADASKTTGLSATIIRTAIKRGELIAENANLEGSRPTYVIDAEPLETWFKKRVETQKVRKERVQHPRTEGQFSARGNRYCSRAPKGSVHPETSWSNPFNVGSRRAGFYHTFKTLGGRATFNQLVEGCIDYRKLYDIEDNADLVGNDLNNHKSGWKRGVLGLVITEKQSKGGEMEYVLQGFSDDAPAKARR